jgi:lysophospholipase L1-like esterase
MNRWVRAYTFLAIQLLNTLLVFAALNVAVAVGARLVSKPPPAPSVAFVDPSVDRGAYTIMSPEQVQRLLEEQSGMQAAGFQYEPWVLFRNPEYHGQFLNTDARGRRHTMAPRARCPHPLRIFVFGGSTTFGYGVADEYTLPSRLQAHLERRYPTRCLQVSNYGQGYFFSSQELLQFVTLLKDGQAPEWAVFVDGANDTYQTSAQRDVPYFSDAVRGLWDARNRGPACPSFDWSWLPAVQLATAMRDRFLGPPPPPPRRSDDPVSVPDSERSGAYVVARYQQNVRMARTLCAEYGVKCRFVWQPTFYDFDRALHPGSPYRGAAPRFWADAYDGIRRWQAPDVLYLGDMFRTVREKVFVDNVHYNEKWTGEIAARIADVIDLESNATSGRRSVPR